MASIRVDIDLDDLYSELDGEDIEYLYKRMMNYSSKEKDYFLSNKMKNLSDVDILTNKQIIDSFIMLLKYEHSDMLEYVKEELNY